MEVFYALDVLLVKRQFLQREQLPLVVLGSLTNQIQSDCQASIRVTGNEKERGGRRGSGVIIMMVKLFF